MEDLIASARELLTDGFGSQHATLRDATRVVGERDGERVIYRLADHHVGHIVEDAFAHAAEEG